MVLCDRQTPKPTAICVGTEFAYRLLEALLPHGHRVTKALGLEGTNKDEAAVAPRALQRGEQGLLSSSHHLYPAATTTLIWLKSQVSKR